MNDHLSRDVAFDEPPPEETDDVRKMDCGHWYSDSRAERIRGREVCQDCAETAWGLIAACNRLLDTEAEVLSVPAEQRDWFMGKPGHRDCFAVARALKAILEERNEMKPISTKVQIPGRP